ncbi:hypothetical protein EGI26_09985 [Lacihabitans sp. CCS-44]|uniref:hypothetical protein n=1 Tax=Lacihabitans sp. CCS-44 TaxID=2487331 RepID=UPI0020CF179A|nr:hypothetical protein [Lacihabitans sp. CCS-44]MCP9755483.1 hypothetical protein [Lacihabitans sp. CCS-44]
MKNIFFYSNLFLSLLLVTLSSSVLAQTSEEKAHPNPPMPVELMLGDRGLNFQLNTTKQLSPTSRFGFFNVTTFFADYKNVVPKNEIFSQSLLTVKVWRKLSAVTGFSINHFVGFKPTAGLQFVHADPKTLVVIQPQMGLTERHHFENFSLLEFKPKFNKHWGLYTRIQTVIDYSPSTKLHNRSYVYLRAGASFKNYQFGLGSNFDFYGPAKHKENSFGMFVRAELF